MLWVQIAQLFCVSNKQIIQLDNFCTQNNFSRLQSEKLYQESEEEYFFVGLYDFDSISHPFAIANFLATPVSRKQQHVSYLLASLFGIINSQQKPEMKLYKIGYITVYTHAEKESERARVGEPFSSEAHLLNDPMSQHRQVFYLTFKVFAIKRSPSQSSAIDGCFWLLWLACLLACLQNKMKESVHNTRAHTHRHLHVLNEAQTNTQINVFLYCH